MIAGGAGPPNERERHEVRTADLLDSAIAILDRAVRLERPGQYQIQAAIGALHAEVDRFADTDWHQILAFYDRLYAFRPSPVVALNRAVAVAMANGPEQGLIELESIAADLVDYPWFHSTRGELLRRVGQHDEATAAFRRAIALTNNRNSLEFLEDRLATIS